MSGEAGTAGQPGSLTLARCCLLLLLSLFVTLPGIASLPPLDRDEARFAQATKQMVESGDFVDIRFQGESRYKKPIGIYWLQAAAAKASGMGADASIWVYRIVSAIGIATAVLALAWTGAKLFGVQAGFLAGVVLAALFACAFEGRIAKTDAVLLACAVLAQGALAQIYVSARDGRTVVSWLPWLFWGAQGAGILVKGPITPLLSLLTVIVLVLLDRDRRWLRELRAGWGTLLAALIALPWLALITWKSGGAFWQESVGSDMFSKIAQGEQSHGAPPGYYIATFTLFFWPFGVFALGAWLVALVRGRSDPRVLFCVAWYTPFWLVFEFIPTKLPHYVLPAYPGLALLAGWSVTQASGMALEHFQRWQRWMWFVGVAGHALVTLGLALAVVALPIYLGAGFSFPSVLAAIAILAAGALAFPRGAVLAPARIVGAAIAAGLSYAMIFWLILPSITALWLSPKIVAAVEENRPCANSVLAAVGFHEPSLVFLAGTDTVLADLEGAANHLLADPACAIALVPVEAQAELAAKLGATAGIQPMATVDGINYSSGSRLSLGLYRIMK
jgi:4-amino-4-deoxy-L-arabinose transferase-like glycosyltransferase